jgi:hypothetical protein
LNVNRDLNVTFTASLFCRHKLGSNIYSHPCSSNILSWTLFEQIFVDLRKQLKEGCNMNIEINHHRQNRKWADLWSHAAWRRPTDGAPKIREAAPYSPTHKACTRWPGCSSRLTISQSACAPPSLFTSSDRHGHQHHHKRRVWQGHQAGGDRYS